MLDSRLRDLDLESYAMFVLQAMLWFWVAFEQGAGSFCLCVCSRLGISRF